MKLSNLTILLTGASGFVGSNLVAKLLDGGVGRLICPIRNRDSRAKLDVILKRRGQNIDSPNLEIIYLPLDSYIDLIEVMRGVDCVIHAAAKVGLGVQRHGENMISESVFITSALVEAAVDSGVKHIVHLSSIAVLESEDGEVISEHSYPKNINQKSPYAISKFYSENYVWGATCRGVKVSTLLPSVIIGDGEGVHKSSAKLTKLLSLKQPFYSKGVNGYVTIDDVVRSVVMMVMREDGESKRYLLSSENLSYHDVQMRLSGREPKIVVANWLLKVVKGALYVAQKLGIDISVKSSMIDSLISVNRYDGSLITREQGFVYNKI